MDHLASFGDTLVPCGLDSNGHPLFRTTHGAIDILVHVVDVPLSDLTEVRGIPCTSAVRTIIDVASSSSPDDVRSMVTSALEQSLFTMAEMHDRLSQPDMVDYPGAVAVRAVLGPELLTEERRPSVDP